jgi:hypothetical protein
MQPFQSLCSSIEQRDVADTTNKNHRPISLKKNSSQKIANQSHPAFLPLPLSTSGWTFLIADFRQKWMVGYINKKTATLHAISFSSLTSPLLLS